MLIIATDKIIVIKILKTITKRFKNYYIRIDINKLIKLAKPTSLPYVIYLVYQKSFRQIYQKVAVIAV